MRLSSGGPLCSLIHYYWQIVSYVCLKLDTWASSVVFIREQWLFVTDSLLSCFKHTLWVTLVEDKHERVVIWDFLTLGLFLCSRRRRWVVTMAPFLRISLNAHDLGVLIPQSEPPICAVKMKESLNTGKYWRTRPQCNTVNSHHLLSSKVSSVNFNKSR